MNILVTGANGFVGGALVKYLSSQSEMKVVAASRVVVPEASSRVKNIRVSGLGVESDWSGALSGIDAVVHAAWMTRFGDNPPPNLLDESRRVNVAGTLALARQAVTAGVRRFVFISTVKVIGEESPAESPFNEETSLSPQGAYAVSKYEAEQALKQFAAESGLELVIIRPPLVYGPGVKGNFAILTSWLQRGLPLPLGGLHNRRSLVGLDNLVNFVSLCVQHPAAANETFLVADGEDLSTSDLLYRMGLAMNKRALLFPGPVGLMTFVAAVVGKKEIARRLLGSLQVDIGKAQNLLGWVPPVAFDKGLTRCVAALVRSRVCADNKAIRFFDISFSLLGLICGSPLLLVLMLIGLFDKGAPLFFQERVGKCQENFTLVKFRTMKPDTESVATHLADASAVTRLGGFLRRTKLDELPQLWNVLKGEMSLVGPRPCLPNQGELIQERECRGVFQVRPGITGLAQISGIDMSTPKLLAETDARMINTLNAGEYFSYIFQTVMGKGSGDRVRK